MNFYLDYIYIPITELVNISVNYVNDVNIYQKNVMSILFCNDIKKDEIFNLKINKKYDMFNNDRYYNKYVNSHHKKNV